MSGIVNSCYVCPRETALAGDIELIYLGRVDVERFSLKKRIKNATGTGGCAKTWRAGPGPFNTNQGKR
jgi:hypothetical protein